MPLASNPEIQHETMKNLDLDETTKELMGFVELTEEEKFMEEERKVEALAEPQRLRISPAGSGMDVGIVVGGKKTPMRPK